ncbi:MAG: MBL fold metallo-hydrolase [Desulfobulbaceae bacterium]|jgi:glyoxylase-like metal-dependent hydrolase (beta-lactamase superfamily II)|nr:MBL fold metallo-hydrolase [Desulfobulbaceae bacterium]
MKIQQLIVGSMGVCCYIASCPVTKKAAVIDPGGDIPKILNVVRQGGLAVQSIIATHSHPDHICGVAELKAAMPQTPFIMHKDEAAFLANPEAGRYFAMFGMDEAPACDQTVVDGERIAVGDEAFTVIHTPGHTPGGMCLLSGDDLLTGDTLFVQGVGRTDFPGGSFDQLMNSIQTRLFSLPEQTKVWPGHGYGGMQSTIGAEKRDNPFL